MRLNYRILKTISPISFNVIKYVSVYVFRSIFAKRPIIVGAVSIHWLLMDSITNGISLPLNLKT